MAPVEECDIVIVGAGSAGCVLAARLSEDGSQRVALVEAGGEPDLFWVKVPLGYGMLFDDPRVNWLHEGQPEPELNGTRLFQPRGKVLGGTSAINGMIYVRGQRADFDDWAAMGNPGWGYDDVLPFFRRAEDNSRGADAFHGTGGPLGVSDIAPHPLADAFVAAGIEAGYPASADFNGPTQEGFGYNQLTIRKGRRSSTHEAYLKPARRRPNLAVIDHARVVTLTFDGHRATGIRYRRGGEERTLSARRAVILAAGAFGSPQLLQLCGIGPAALLRDKGIAVRADLPGVGENLQDHFTVGMVYRCRRPVTINDAYNNRLRRYAMGARYLLTRGGLMATNASFAGGYLRSSPDQERPDLKFNLALWGRAASGRARERLGLLPYSSFTPSVALLRPHSRGSVRVASPDPEAGPEIRFNFLDNEDDRRLSVHGFKLLREVLRMPAMAPYAGEEVTPGEACRSDEEILAACRTRGRSNQHAAGTCRMGPGPLAVVDARLRVRGLDGLRVADASVMPAVVSGNTNAAVIMIAEKAAAILREDRR
jgi:choline dehydrogenase